MSSDPYETQGTVWAFDAETRSGEVVKDDGSRLRFDALAFDASGLRLLRPGQRVRIMASHDVVTALTILTLHEPR